MGRKHSDVEVTERREWLERAICTRGWSLLLRTEYCRRYNIGASQAYDDRGYVMERLREAAEGVDHTGYVSQWLEKNAAAQARMVVKIEEEVVRRARLVKAMEEDPEIPLRGLLAQVDRTIADAESHLEKLMQAEASIRGLDSPRRVEISGPHGAPLSVSGLDLDALEGLAWGGGDEDDDG